MNRLKLITAILIILMSIAQAGQTGNATSKQLDFWVGDWIVTDTTPKATNPKGSNSIRRLYGGKVIHEQFKMGTFEGQSWSVFNPQNKRWNQTWVDNSGGYIAMTSTEVDGNLAIQTLPKRNQPNQANRMVFKNIKPDSFTWIWESTVDGGKTWTLAWRLEYLRRKPGKDSMNPSLQKADLIQARLSSWL